ncbi:MAG: class I SAM-dependent methyltransferase [Chitinophagaceae bacterium]
MRYRPAACSLFQGSKEVTGIDVSASMLTEAKNNMEKHLVNNVQLLESNSPDILTGKQFDLGHSFIVMQHIPVHIGYHVFEILLQLIKKGGYGMIHLTYSNDKTLIKNQKNKLKSRYQFFSRFFNVVSGRHPDKPYMHMNNYNLATVFRIIEKAGISKSYVELTNHGGYRGLCLYLAK